MWEVWCAQPLERYYGTWLNSDLEFGRISNDFRIASCINRSCPPAWMFTICLWELHRPTKVQQPGGVYLVRSRNTCLISMKKNVYACASYLYMHCLQEWSREFLQLSLSKVCGQKALCPLNMSLLGQGIRVIANVVQPILLSHVSLFTLWLLYGSARCYISSLTSCDAEVIPRERCESLSISLSCSVVWCFIICCLMILVYTFRCRYRCGPLDLLVSAVWWFLPINFNIFINCLSLVRVLLVIWTMKILKWNFENKTLSFSTESIVSFF